MPFVLKTFVGLVVMGFMLARVQFCFYVYMAALDHPASIAAYFAWLRPLSDISPGLILSGIVLALAIIGTKVLPFSSGTSAS